MEIRQWMKRPVYTIKPLDSLQHARDVMEARGVKELPVVVNSELVGIITDRDLRDAFPSVFEIPLFGRSKKEFKASDPNVVTVEMVMTPYVHTLGPGDSMAAAARLMRRERISAVPIVDGKRVVGIITRSDILDCFADMVGPPESAAAAEKVEGKNATVAAPRRARR